MKLLLDDKATRGYDLNANEACIFAAILKCTRAGRGWFANYRDLAAALPFVISHETVRRAVEKLLNLGLIERKEKSLFALTQNVTELTQNVTELTQNVTELTQNVTNSPSPYNPLIINNEKMNERTHATCAHACDTREPNLPTFLDLRKEFSKKGGGGMTTHMEMQAVEEWNKCSDAKKIKLLEALSSGAHFKPRLDWLIADFPEPEPEFLRGDEDQDIVQVRYNGMFKLCSRTTMRLFNLEWVRDWNK